MPATFTVKQDRAVRGLTYLPHGQQYSGYLPKGEYSVLGECTVSYSDLGETKHAPAVKLRSAKGEQWYVAPAILPVS